MLTVTGKWEQFLFLTGRGRRYSELRPGRNSDTKCLPQTLEQNLACDIVKVLGAQLRNHLPLTGTLTQTVTECAGVCVRVSEGPRA